MDKKRCNSLIRKADSLFHQSHKQVNGLALEHSNPECINSEEEYFHQPIEEIQDQVITHVDFDYGLFLDKKFSLATTNIEPDVYYYHSDHLGSASRISDNSGTPVQHLQYLAYGDKFVDHKASASSYSERFTFTGKERDEEAGYSYHGTRYYDASLMCSWFSVDPLSDKYPSMSPYNYCAWNPVKLVVPDGRDIWKINSEGELIWQSKSETDRIVAADGTFVNVMEGVLAKGSDVTKKQGDLTLDFGNNKEKATEVFEFMADHSNVEFSLLGIAKSKNKDATIEYFLTTSFQSGTDHHGSEMSYEYASMGRMRSHAHNHPTESVSNSTSITNGGLTYNGAPIRDGNDAEFANGIRQGSPDCVFFVYGHNAKGYGKDVYRPYYGTKTKGVRSYKPIDSKVTKTGQYKYTEK